MKNLLYLFTIALLAACNPCADTECNNGWCDEGDCECHPGYSGNDCAVEDRAIYLGTFNLSGDCVEEDDYIRIVRDNSKGDRVDILNLFNTNIIVKAHVEDGGLVIPSQTFGTGNIGGSGIVNGGLLLINVNDGNTSCAINGILAE